MEVMVADLASLIFQSKGTTQFNSEFVLHYWEDNLLVKTMLLWVSRKDAVCKIGV